MNSKSWYKSKGFWLGVITALVGSLDIVAGLLKGSDLSMEGIAVASLGVLKVWERFARGDLSM